MFGYKKYDVKCAAHSFEKHPVQRNVMSDYGGNGNEESIFQKCGYVAWRVCSR